MSTKKVAIMTDSNSGITQSAAKELGITVLPMPFFINEALFLEDITLDQHGFYEKLDAGADVSTSQPSPMDVTDTWDRLLTEYDEVVYIPMSSGLSSSCQTAMMLADDYEGRVFVVNNQRISVTQRQSVLDAIDLAKAGKSGSEIRDILMREKMESSIYIMVDTLYYLKKGGRITPAAALIGSALNLKPVLQIQGDKLDAYRKVRGRNQAKKVLLKAMEDDFATRFRDAAEKKQMHLEIAYSYNEEDALAFREEVLRHFPDFGEIIVHPLSLSVSCHIGPGSLALACSKYIPELTE